MCEGPWRRSEALTYRDDMRADVGEVVIDLRDGGGAPEPTAPASTPGLELDEERHRAVRVAAVALLIVLNMLDIVTTSAFLEAGVPEGNPIASMGIEAGWIGFVKAGLLLALGIRALDGRPRLASTCAMWFVVGVYAMAICVNLVALQAAGGSLL